MGDFKGRRKGETGNPDGGETGKREAECPLCGEIVPYIPRHLRHDCDRTDNSS